MPNFDAKRAVSAVAVLLLAASAPASRAGAEPRVQGFAVERFYPSAPGGGWFVMDELDLHGGLGGAVELTTGYSLNALHVNDGSRRLDVVSNRAFADFGFAATYDRFRLSANLNSPLLTTGESGTAAGYHFVAPSLDLGNHPDTISDLRIGLDARLVGDAAGAFRLGAGAALFVPSGDRADYDTDGTYRAMVRVLAAGNRRAFRYAGQLGVHVRPLDESPAPESPRGSELLFGAALGMKVPSGTSTAFVVGPEIFGATAFRSFFGATTTAVEALLTGRLEGTAYAAPVLRVKLGAGGGIDANFGAPDFRAVFAIELLDHDVDGG
jgi:hypothetical protein